MYYLSPTVWRYNAAPATTSIGQQITVQDLYYLYYIIAHVFLFSALWSTSRYRRLILNVGIQLAFIYLAWTLRRCPDGETDPYALRLMHFVNVQNVFVVGALCGWWNVTRSPTGHLALGDDDEKKMLGSLDSEPEQRGGFESWCAQDTSDRAIAVKLGVPYVLSIYALSGNPAIAGWQKTNQALFLAAMGLVMAYSMKATKPR